MRLHHLLCEAVVDIAFEVFNGQRPARAVVDRKLRSNKKWGSRDRTFIGEQAYELLRYARLYWEIRERKAPGTRAEWWPLLGTQLILQNIPLPDWPSFENLDEDFIRNRATSLRETRKIRESIPDWLDATGKEALPAAWDETIHALNQQARVVLRTNTLKISRSLLQSDLAKQQIETTETGKDGLVLAQRKSLLQTKAFKQGCFEFRDASSQQVAPFLDVKPGMRVIDCCAGAGGKTLHLAALMENKGQIVAMDVEAFKLQELEKRARRAGATNIHTHLITDLSSLAPFFQWADRVLMDAPCSGLGVLRRNPDSKWRLNPQFLVEIRATQQYLLSHYPSMLKPGGKLVYATCSVLKSENQEQIHTFLRQNATFQLEKEKIILPQDEGFDGFYMGLLNKTS